MLIKGCLSRSVASRNRSAHDVGKRTGVTIGDSPCQSEDRRIKDRVRANDLGEPFEASFMFGRRTALNNPSVMQGTGESNPHPNPSLSLSRHRLRN
jgi:hypothetical protein